MLLRDATHQTLPIERVAAAEDQVHDIRHVVTMPLADEQAVPDQFLRRGDSDWCGRENSRTAVLDPAFIDLRDAVAHAEDQIDEVLADGCLREPVRVFEARHEPCIAKRSGCGHDGRRLEKQIEVLGLSVDPGVFVDGVCAGDDIGDVGGVEGSERAAVNLALLFGDPEITMGQGFPFLGCEPARPAALQIRHRHLMNDRRALDTLAIMTRDSNTRASSGSSGYLAHV